MDGEFLKTANPQIVLPLIKQIVKLYYIVFFWEKSLSARAMNAWWQGFKQRLFKILPYLL